MGNAGGEVKVDNQMGKFLLKNEKVMDAAVNKMADDIVQLYQVNVTRKLSRLQESAEVDKKESMHYEVWAGRDAETGKYAGAQEAGKAGSKIFRKFTTPGTGPHAMKKAGERVRMLSLHYLVQAAQRVKMK